MHKPPPLAAATQAPALREAIKQRYLSAANDNDVSETTKANLAAFMADRARIELFFDTLTNLDRAINTDREIASSNKSLLPSDAVDGALALSPEKTTAASTTLSDVAPQFADGWAY